MSSLKIGIYLLIFVIGLAISLSLPIESAPKSIITFGIIAVFLIFLIYGITEED